MLDFIKKLIKRGKRKRICKPKNTPWKFHQPGLFKSHYTIERGYDFETATMMLKKKTSGQHHNKFPK